MHMKKGINTMSRMSDLLSRFYWPIYMRLVQFEISGDRVILKEILVILHEEMGKAAPKTIIAEPVVRLIMHITNEKCPYPKDIIQVFRTRTFEIQKTYNDIYFNI